MSEKRYKIVITETCVEEKIRGKEWEKCASGEGHAYTPEILKKVDVTREIYTQNTAYLNLVDIIKAVNNITR